VENMAYRVIATNQVPDHATIARFRQRHETAIAGLVSGVLGLCAQAGMVKVGVIAVDWTKVHATASPHSNRDYDQIARRSSRRPGGSTPLRTSVTAKTRR
jgi:transposase